ncbi:hypothetical protein GC194_14810 [bacterium]|nr:hypothetical protein [bacterium]
MKFTAKLISYLGHPIFLYTYLYILYWVLYPYPIHSLPTEGIALITLIIFINTAVLPVVFLLLGKRNLITQNQRERKKTIIVVAVIYTVTYFSFPEKYLPHYLRMLLLAIVAGLLVLYVVTGFFKISLHASSWGGFVAVMLYQMFQFGAMFFYPFMLATLAAGLVGFSRLYLDAHTNKELYSGYVSGFAVTLACMLYLPA